MQIIPNQSENRFVSRLMKNGQKSIQLNPINSETSIRINPKLSFQSRSTRINPNHSDLGFIRIDSDWKFGLDQSKLRMIWIENLVSDWSDWCLGINRIKSDWFLTVFHQTRYKTFFGSVWNDSHWLGYRYRNGSE